MCKSILLKVLILILLSKTTPFKLGFKKTDWMEGGCPYHSGGAVKKGGKPNNSE
jgi:hypothetical protein